MLHVCLIVCALIERKVIVGNCCCYSESQTLAYSKRSVLIEKMHTTELDTSHTDSRFKKKCFKKQSCTYLVKILPLVPAAEFCVCPMDNSTTFSILKLGTLHGNQHFSLVPFTGTGRFLAGLFYPLE